MKLADLLQLEPDDTQDCDVFGLANDSRKVQPGDLFLAYPGALADGRLFCQQAIDKGALAVAYEPNELPESFIFLPTIIYIPIPELAQKLAAIASQFYHHLTQALSIIGVTGTNGKTTIAYQLAQAFHLLGLKSSYIGTIGQGEVSSLEPLSNTTPDALQLQSLFSYYQQSHIKQVCMEVSSHALDQQRVNCIDFKQAIYTNLSHDHLDYHHTMQAYAQAKALLFTVPSLEWAIVNHDDTYAPLMLAKLPPKCKKLTYGLQEGADVRALKWKMDMTGTTFEVASPWGVHSVQVQTLGVFNLYNSLAVFSSLLGCIDNSPTNRRRPATCSRDPEISRDAKTSCLDIDPPGSREQVAGRRNMSCQQTLAEHVSIQDVIAVMAKLVASPGRLEIVRQEPCVIVDYAHTPDALENVLSTLTELKQAKLWVVFGCGGDRDRTKRPMMGKIAGQLADCVVLTSDNPRSEDPLLILDEIAAGLESSSAHVVRITDRKEAIHHALQFADKQDIILIAGKGHEDYQIIGSKRLNFSDQAVVREYTLV